MRIPGRVLLLWGIVFLFSLPAMAVDVKIKGEFYAAGMYLDKANLRKESGSDGPSTAFYYQRLRLNTTFVAAPGLLFVTRVDILERSWGSNRANPNLPAWDSAGTRAENENIAVDLAYMIYVSPIGIFLAGYQSDGYWGTVFGDSSIPRGKLIYVLKRGPAMLGMLVAKDVDGENSRSAVTIASGNPHINASDRDCDIYGAFGKYFWKNGEAGILGTYLRAAAPRILDSYGMKAYQINIYKLIPYIKAKIGPVEIQSEINYAWGKAANYETPGARDVDLRNLAGWIDATAALGMFYLGGSLAYVSGDDPETPEIQEGGVLSGGQDWNPCLIMWNNDRTYWAGNIYGYDGTHQSGPMTNAWFFQARGGVRPDDKLDMMVSLSYAVQDKKFNPGLLYNDYGWEVDLTASYKITNNLSFMAGGAYLFTGRFYKGFSDTNNIRDDFLVINKLMLTF